MSQGSFLAPLLFTVLFLCCADKQKQIYVISQFEYLDILTIWTRSCEILYTHVLAFFEYILFILIKFVILRNKRYQCFLDLKQKKI